MSHEINKRLVFSLALATYQDEKIKFYTELGNWQYMKSVALVFHTGLSFESVAANTKLFSY